MEPTSNTEFIAQQAQFSQLETTNTMSANIASNNGVSTALSLVGKTVSLTDPDNKNNTISGIVSSATISGKDSTITVNKHSYPLSALKNVTETTTN
jgi:flagellar basal-body rod modification protein FlgD